MIAEHEEYSIYTVLSKDQSTTRNFYGEDDLILLESAQKKEKKGTIRKRKKRCYREMDKEEYRIREGCFEIQLKNKTLRKYVKKGK